MDKCVRQITFNLILKQKSCSSNGQQYQPGQQNK